MSRSNKKTSHQPKLSNGQHAALYLQLACLEEAGLPAQQAFEIIRKNNPKIHARVRQLQKYLRTGKTITEAGVRAGVFRQSDKDLLNVGETCGNLWSIYKQLADHYEQKEKRSKKIKSQCFLPAITLLIALMIQPLPALFLNEISGFEYIQISVFRLFKILLLLYIIFNLSYWLTDGRLRFLGLKNWVYNIQYKLPVLSTWLVHKQINGFLNSLGLMLNAGLSIMVALEKAINTIKNPILKKQFKPLILAINKGGSFGDAIATIKPVEHQTIQQIVSGEQSGKLADTLMHISIIGNENINLQEDLFAEWIPKIFYFLISGWIVYSIISSSALTNPAVL